VATIRPPRGAGGLGLPPADARPPGPPRRLSHGLGYTK